MDGVFAARSDGTDTGLRVEDGETAWEAEERIRWNDDSHQSHRGFLYGVAGGEFVAIDAEDGTPTPIELPGISDDDSQGRNSDPVLLNHAVLPDAVAVSQPGYGYNGSQAVTVVFGVL
ncbi:hypothetical protein [Allosalinactinospora lopnorensis]|uniref:hypothetical protein n=1 Tax=Allosalinactinospora lopnorensis TaxID=1352348 RepID=UPI000623FB4B|nr:hypothetical protein [Allosalinactinospora lopnorensis]